MRTRPTILIVGGSDAGFSAALGIRELDPTIAPLMVLADEYPNFSICGIPFYLWRSTRADWGRDAHRQALRVLTSPGDGTVWSWRYPTSAWMSHNQTFRVRRQEQTNDAQTRLRSESGEHIGIVNKSIGAHLELYAKKVVQLFASAKYLANPQAGVPGTKMTFIGLKDPQQVEDVIAYLKEATKTE